MRFVNLGDNNRYRDELKVKIPKGQDGKLWSMELRLVKLIDIKGGYPRNKPHWSAEDFENVAGTGVKPYIAVSPESWFDPE